MIISIINQKGGTGKSTIACNLAVAYALAGKDIVLVDSDKQGTAANFRAFRKLQPNLVQFPTWQILTNTIDDDVPKIRSEITVIDVGGHDSQVFRGAMACSDVVIVPMQPSGPDIWGAETTLSILMDLRKIKKDLRVYGLLNMVNPSAKAVREMNDVIHSLEDDFDFKFFESRLVARVQYQYTLTTGMSVLEQSADMKARAEFEALFKEICDVTASC